MWKRKFNFFNPRTGTKINKSYEEIMLERGYTSDQNLDYYVVADLTKMKLNTSPNTTIN